MLVVVFLAAPALSRTALVLAKGGGLGMHDLRGSFSDLAVVLFAAVAVLFFMRLRLWMGVAAGLIWGLVHYGAYEHIKTLDALPSTAHAGFLVDWTFVKGSALNVSNYPLFTAIMLISSLGPWLVARFALRNEPARPPRFFFVAAPLSIIVLFFWREDLATAQWRQVHFVHANLQQMAAGGAAKTTSGHGGALGLSRQDLDGRPIIKLGNRGKNVLLVILEGVSGAYLDTVSRRHGVTSGVRMPHLDEIAGRGLVYDNFVANQRQTNRGEYAILCGDYPNLTSGTSKMTQYVKGGMDTVCLPELLRGAGYETVYLQAAPLGFMLKDQFMPRVGFSRVYGDTYFESSYKRSEWGVDDRTLFEKGVEVVRGLQKSGKPWFATLLTVGTHHPYTVPGLSASPYPADSFDNAVWHLDESVEWFYRTLEDEGLLEDTLVIFTSDESAGGAAGMGEAAQLLKLLSQNWGFLAVIPPSGERMTIDDNFMQVDLAISILDYLGLGHRGWMLSGRSVFRRYERERPVFFGNALTGMIGGVDTDGTLYLCRENFSACKEFRFTGRPLFSRDLVGMRDVEVKPGFLEDMASLARSPSAREEGFVLTLVSDMSVPLFGDMEQLIFGQQDLMIPKGSRVDIDLEAEITGEGGQVVLSLDVLATAQDDMRDDGAIDSTISPPLEVGDVWRLRNSYFAGQGFGNFKCFLHARKISGKAESKVSNARIRVWPSADGAGSGPLKKKHESSLNSVVYKDNEIMDEAIERFQSILKKNPDDRWAHIYLARIYDIMGLADKAEYHIRSAGGTYELNEKER